MELPEGDLVREETKYFKEELQLTQYLLVWNYFKSVRDREEKVQRLRCSLKDCSILRRGSYSCLFEEVERLVVALVYVLAGDGEQNPRRPTRFAHVICDHVLFSYQYRPSNPFRRLPQKIMELLVPSSPGFAMIGDIGYQIVMSSLCRWFWKLY